MSGLPESGRIVAQGDRICAGRQNVAKGPIGDSRGAAIPALFNQLVGAQ
jgi:hypothetical protein